MKIFGVGSFFALMFISSSAAHAVEVCFERRYDQAHMQKHTLQEVTRIRLKLQGEAVVTGHIAAAFRESSNYQKSKVKCEFREGAGSCTVDKNGGSFSISETPQGIKLVNTSSIRFGGVEDGITIGREAEHRTFLLFTAPENSCG